MEKLRLAHVTFVKHRKTLPIGLPAFVAVYDIQQVVR
jgi:hypothetical protein